MHHVTLRYTLRNGQRGTLPCLACSTSAALLWAIDAWGLQLRTCSARCSPASTAGAAQPGAQP